jgi:hypothetical protein
VEKYEGEKKSGLFKISEQEEVHGDLSINGGNTLLTLTRKDFFDVPNGCTILGNLHDRTKVSLLNCTRLGLVAGNKENDRFHGANVFPHFVAFGSEHLVYTDSAIASVHFLIDDAATLFYDFDAFGMVVHNRQDIIDAIIKDNAETHSRTIKFGEQPEIFYFTGKREIFSVETSLGTVSASHGIGYTFPGPKGFNLKNKIFATIKFPQPVCTARCITDVLTLIRFFEVIVGRPQNVLELTFQLPSPEDRPVLLDVYWCMRPVRANESEGRKPHPADTLLDAVDTPEVFGGVLKNWLEQHPARREARFRFSSGFADMNNFSIDRLVGAANMFDILPASATPAPPPLSDEIVEAQKASRAAFLKLPDSPERSSVLGALGRLGKNTLKQKVKSRAKLVLAATGDKFPDLELVADEAVNCRNYFVHGTESKILYSENADFLSFLTESLEFIFAAADLIDAGWDMGAWSKESTTQSHPFGRYRVNYAMAIAKLKSALNQAAKI